jgi:hypothetical protein
MARGPRPEVVVKAVLDAARRDRAAAPVGAEAWVGHGGKRLAPRLVAKMLDAALARGRAVIRWTWHSTATPRSSARDSGGSAQTSMESEARRAASDDAGAGDGWHRPPPAVPIEDRVSELNSEDLMSLVDALVERANQETSL